MKPVNKLKKSIQNISIVRFVCKKLRGSKEKNSDIETTASEEITVKNSDTEEERNIEEDINEEAEELK